jgi:hypothetical protein
MPELAPSYEPSAIVLRIEDSINNRLSAWRSRIRCAVCSAAWNPRHRTARVRRAAARPEGNSALRYGTRSTYVNHGCHCERCVERNARRTLAARPVRRLLRDSASRLAGPDRCYQSASSPAGGA